MGAPWSYPVGKSDCCGADIYEDGICTGCGEHSECVDETEDDDCPECSAEMNLIGINNKRSVSGGR